ncbi:hypothetical protein AAG906_040391 [Vitis piasezkii]
MATQPRTSLVFISFLTILSSAVLAKYQYENVSPFSQHNIGMQISLFASYIYFMMVVVYEILDSTELSKLKKMEDISLFWVMMAMLRWPCTIPNKSNPTCFYLILILIPYFGWFLLVMWTMFLVKIACYWDKTFYNFDMEGGQEVQRPQV